MWNKVFYILITIIAMYVFKDKVYRTMKLLQYYYKFFLIYFFINLMAETSKNVTKLLGVKWHLRNPEIVSEDRGAVFVLNHQSALDLLGLCNLWYAWKKVSCIVKKELFYVWPFGLGLYLMDAIFVDRGSRLGSNKRLQDRASSILQKKIKILVFPEGTRNSDNTKFLPFKKGAFNIAVEAQVPIIPIVISRYHFIDSRQRIFNSGNVVVQCLEPISTEGLTLDDVPELIDRVHSKMLTVYTELSKEVSTLPQD